MLTSDKIHYIIAKQVTDKEDKPVVVAAIQNLKDGASIRGSFSL